MLFSLYGKRSLSDNNLISVKRSTVEVNHLIILRERLVIICNNLMVYYNAYEMAMLLYLVVDLLANQREFYTQWLVTCCIPLPLPNTRLIFMTTISTGAQQMLAGSRGTPTSVTVHWLMASPASS